MNFKPLNKYVGWKIDWLDWRIGAVYSKTWRKLFISFLPLVIGVSFDRFNGEF